MLDLLKVITKIGSLVDPIVISSKVFLAKLLPLQSVLGVLTTTKIIGVICLAIAFMLFFRLRQLNKEGQANINKPQRQKSRAKGHSHQQYFQKRYISIDMAKVALQEISDCSIYKFNSKNQNETKKALELTPQNGNIDTINKTLMRAFCKSKKHEEQTQSEASIVINMNTVTEAKTFKIDNCNDSQKKESPLSSGPSPVSLGNGIKGSKSYDIAFRSIADLLSSIDHMGNLYQMPCNHALFTLNDSVMGIILDFAALLLIKDLDNPASNNRSWQDRISVDQANLAVISVESA